MFRAHLRHALRITLCSILHLHSHLMAPCSPLGCLLTCNSTQRLIYSIVATRRQKDEEILCLPIPDGISGTDRELILSRKKAKN